MSQAARAYVPMSQEANVGTSFSSCCCVALHDMSPAPISGRVAGTAGNKGGRSVFTAQIHSKQIYQRIGSLNVKIVRYSSTLSTLMTVLVIRAVVGGAPL